MLALTINDKVEVQQLTIADGVVEVGRGPSRDGTRRVSVRDGFVSRDHLRLEERPGGRVRVVNLSSKAPLTIDGSSTLPPGADGEYLLPVRVGIGATTVDVDAPEPERIDATGMMTVSPPVRSQTQVHPSLLAFGASASLDEVVGWLETVIAIQKSVTPAEFYQQTATALVEQIGLDSGLVILRDGDGWRVVAAANKGERAAGGRAFSLTILTRVLAEKRTFYVPAMAAGGGESLAGVQGVVVSPVFDSREEVAGVVYGTRGQRARVREIGKLEAQVVQLLAAAVGSGITRREKDEEAHRLRVAKEAAEEADRTKSGFLAMVSHELRTPLTTIIGYSEMLQEQTAADDHPQYAGDLAAIHTAGQHLLALINDILDLSKIEAGKLDIAREPYAPASTVQDLMVTCEPLAKKNNNRLDLDCPADLGRGVGDPTRIRQCVLNLVANACKFTANGTVKVTARRQTDAAGDTLTVAVADTGIGMTPEQVARLYQPFTQVDSSAGRKYGGTGLGLAISQKLCRAMGGRITVESVADQGSTFTMTIKAVL